MPEEESTRSDRKGSKPVKYDATATVVNPGNINDPAASPASSTTAIKNKGKSAKQLKKCTKSRSRIISESSSSSEHTSSSDDNSRGVKRADCTLTLCTLASTW